MRGTHNPFQPLFYGALVLAAFLSTNLYSEGSTKDRKDGQLEAEEEGNKKTDQQLQPQKMMHDMKQMEHMQKSQEARQRQDFSTAQQEQQMAMMEQMKSQQLQQQITANKDSAQKNKAGADKLSKEDDAPQKQQKGYDADVISVRKGDVPGKPNSNESATATPGGESGAVASPQLADLTSFSKDFLPQPAPQAGPPPTETPPTGNPATRLLTDLEKMDRASVVYDDSAKLGGSTPKVEAAQVRLLTSASIGGASALGGTAGQASAETDIWGNKSEPEKAAGDATTARSRGPASVGSGEGAEGGGASSSLGALDKDFFDPCPSAKEWKKMTKQARDEIRPECRKLAKKCEKEDKKSKKKASDQCREWKGEKVAEAKGKKRAER